MFIHVTVHALVLWPISMLLLLFGIWADNWRGKITELKVPRDLFLVSMKNKKVEPCPLLATCSRRGTACSSSMTASLSPSSRVSSIYPPWSLLCFHSINGYFDTWSFGQVHFTVEWYRWGADCCCLLPFFLRRTIELTIFLLIFPCFFFQTHGSQSSSIQEVDVFIKKITQNQDVILPKFYRTKKYTQKRFKSMAIQTPEHTWI